MENTGFQKWLEEHYTPEYYYSIWKSKKHGAKYETWELKDIYDNINNKL